MPVTHSRVTSQCRCHHDTHWSICSCISKSPRSSPSLSKSASSPSATLPDTSITLISKMKNFSLYSHFTTYLGLVHWNPSSCCLWLPKPENQILAHPSSMIPHLYSASSNGIFVFFGFRFRPSKAFFYFTNGFTWLRASAERGPTSRLGGISLPWTRFGIWDVKVDLANNQSWTWLTSNK